MIDTIEGHRRICQNLATLMILVDDLDEEMSPADRLELYEAIGSHADFLALAADELAGLWGDPGAAAGVVYE